MRVGADEAGKGPVLGPMIVAAVRAPPAALPDGIADSKRLSPERRERLAAELHATDAIDVCVVAVAVEHIDDPGTDMNSLTVGAQAAAIAGVASDTDTVLVDAGDVCASRFGRRIREHVANAGTEIEVQAEHGADDAYPIVGAASIVAKVERDARIADLRAEYGEIGSGYPSDPTTREFLADYVQEHGELPACARTSWSTCEDVLAAAEQSSLAEF